MCVGSVWDVSEQLGVGVQPRGGGGDLREGEGCL